MCNGGIWVSGRNHSWICREQIKEWCVWAVTVCQFSSSPSLNALRFENGPACHGCELLGTSPCSVSAGERPSLSPGVVHQGSSAICKVWQVSLPLVRCFSLCKEQWGFTPELGVWSCEPPNPVALCRSGRAVALCKLLVVSGVMPRSSFLNYWGKSRKNAALLEYFV